LLILRECTTTVYKYVLLGPFPVENICLLSSALLKVTRQQRFMWTKVICRKYTNGFFAAVDWEWK